MKSNINETNLSLLRKDNLLNNVIQIEKKENSEKLLSEYLSLFLYTASITFYGAANFHLKFIQIKYKSEYEMFSFIFWRNLIFLFIILIFLKYKKKEILDPRNFPKKSQIWLCVKTFGQFLAVIFTLNSLEKLRVGTANTFISMTPAAIILLCVFLLKEQFHWRYPIGVLICFSGVLLMIFNEGNGSNLNELENNNLFDTLIGVFWGTCNLFCIASLAVSTKALNNDNIDYDNICFYIGANNLLCALFVIIFIKFSFSFGFYFVLSTTFNAIIYFFATYFYTLSLKGVDLLKTTSLGYLQIVVATFLGVAFLGENVYFTDFLGSFIILGYNIYNALYPVKFD